MKKPAALVLGLGAMLAGGGVALAQAGVDDPPPVEAPPADPHEDTPLGPPEEAPPVEVEATEEEVVEEEVVEEETVEADAPLAEDNHGAVVSQAAHDCPTGEGGVHGECVSAVARDNHGHEDDAGASASGGRGNGRGQGDDG